MSGRQIRGFQPSYSSFLATTYHTLMDLWMEGDLRDFWVGIRGFVTFLPKEIKAKIKPQIEEVRKKLRKVGTGGSIDYYTGLLQQSKDTDNILGQYSLPILDEIMVLLDERGYLEKGSRILRAEDFQKIEETK